MSQKVELIELVRRFRASQTEADAAAVIDHIFPALHAYILRRAPNAVDDIRSETLVTIAYNLYKFDLSKTSEEMWGLCYVIARRQISKYFKTQERQPYTSVDGEELSQVEAISALRSFEQSQNDPQKLGQHALDLVKKSDPDCFKLLWDRYIVGSGVDAIAYELNVNYAAAAQRIHRCKELAGFLMQKEGLHG